MRFRRFGFIFGPNWARFFLQKNKSSNFVSQIHFSTSGKWMTLQSNLWVPFVICYQIVISFSASTSSIRETQTYSHHHHHDLFSFFHYYNAENFLTKDKAKYVKKISSTTTLKETNGSVDLFFYFSI